MYILLGAHGTGKSSLLQALKNSGWCPDYYVTDGFSRPAKNIKTTLELDKAQEQVIINELSCWAYENYISQQVISTRSPIDAILYTQYYTPALDTNWMQEIFDKYKDQVEGIFYIPIEFELENDGVRFTNQEDQKNIDLMMQKFIKDKNLDVVTITGTLEERTKAVIKTMFKDMFVPTEDRKQP